MVELNKIRTFNYGEYSKEGYRPTLGVKIGKLTLYFSYDTIVAFNTPPHGLVVSENVWSRTTGKHLNWITPKENRVSHTEFKAKLDEVLKEYNLED